MADDIFDTRRRLAQAGASVADKIDRADPPPAATGPSKTVVRSSGVTVSQALRSERPAAQDEGVRSFGAPLGTESDRQKQKDAQSTDTSQ